MSNPPTPATCAAHRVHVPRLWAPVEAHHYIPREWQALTTPAAPGPVVAGVWDPRTVPLCRTGHGNTHYWIVRLSRAVKASRTETPAVSAKAVFGRRQTSEQQIALLAHERLLAAGGPGSLLALVDGGRMGGMFGSGG